MNKIFIGVLFALSTFLVGMPIAQATFSGTRLAREFDSDNPDQHKPFIRERRLINATEKDYQLDAETLLVKPYH